jgi:hypothetical protein
MSEDIGVRCPFCGRTDCVCHKIDLIRGKANLEDLIEYVAKRLEDNHKQGYLMCWEEYIDVDFISENEGYENDSWKFHKKEAEEIINKVLLEVK